MIYPVDSAIQRLNNWNQDNSVNIGYGACAAAFSSRGNMTKSGKKSNKNEGNKPESFIWSDDEVELLLNVTTEYKAAKSIENIDWESC